jgi:hypothetical protein
MLKLDSSNVNGELLEVSGVAVDVSQDCEDD